MIRYYHYCKLNGNDKLAYKTILSAIKSFKSYARIKQVANIQETVDAVKNDNPQLFYVDWHNLLYVTMKGETALKLRYLVNRETAEKYMDGIKKVASKLKGNCTYSTVRNVHDYLATTVSYDYNGVKGKGYRVNDHNAMGALIDKVAVCEGIARAYQLLLRLLKVDCTYISGIVEKGRSKGAAHAWNVVIIGAKPYRIDVTWDLQEDKAAHKYFMTPLSYF